MSAFRATTALLVLALAVVPRPAPGEDLLVVIERPVAGQPAFGEVVFEAVVDPPGSASRVQLLVDGRVVADLTGPPFRTVVDLGQENLEHHFEVRAYDRDGEVANAFLVSPRLRVDFAVDAELQQLYVTVTRNGERILDLDRGDFTIIDMGQRQEMVTFERGDVPLTAVLLIDSSASMRGERLRHALRGAAAFAQRLRPQDEASIYLFSDRLLYASPFSPDPDTLYAGIGEVQATGGTALNDSLYLVLKRLEERQGRRVVVLLSDGVDSHSTLDMADVTWLARRSRAVVYWIRTEPGDKASSSRYSSWKNPEAYREEYAGLVEMVKESGGRILDIDRLDDAEKAFEELMDEIRGQYVLGYYPSDVRHDGSWHRVHVRVEDRGVAVRTRGGYIDY